ncbi:MAG: Holliday junction resolvase RuvX [Chloroflexi bacterium]|nr:Holliday junction resolvase RuvX [Chloroflexota bacterium]
MTRVIGLDHGSRRIGVAVGDTETRIAFARPALRPRSAAAAADAVRRLAAEEGAETIVLGLPYLMDGSEGRQAGTVRRFGERLGRIGLEVVYEDERLSSWAAGEVLSEGGSRATRESGELDSAAARLILQQYLDAGPPPGPPEETA